MLFMAISGWGVGDSDGGPGSPAFRDTVAGPMVPGLVANVTHSP